MSKIDSKHLENPFFSVQSERYFTALFQTRISLTGIVDFVSPHFVRGGVFP